MSLEAIVPRYPVGCLPHSYATPDLACAITSLTREQILGYKRASHAYARELSLESNAQKARDIVRTLLG